MNEKKWFWAAHSLSRQCVGVSFNLHRAMTTVFAHRLHSAAAHFVIPHSRPSAQIDQMQ